MKSENILSKLFVDTFFYYLGKIIPGIIGFMTIPLLMHLFGEKIYGEYALIISTILLLSTFFSGWLGQTLLRFYTSKNDQHYYIHATYSLLQLTNLFVLPFLILVLLILDYSFIFSLFVSLNFLFISYYSVLYTEARAQLNTKRILIGEALRAFFFLIILFTGSFFITKEAKIQLLLIIISYATSYLIGCCYFYDKSKKLLFGWRDIHEVLHGTVMKKIIGYGLPVAFWMISSYLLNVSDRYIISFYLNNEKVGEYSAVYDIFSKFMNFSFAPFVLALQPILIKMYNEGQTKNALIYIKKSVGYLFCIFVVLLVSVFICRDFIVHVLLDISNQEVTSIIIPVYISAFVWNISMLIHKPLELREKTLKMLYAVIIAFIVNLIGNLIFIPQYGIIAAAYTTLIGTLLYILIILYFLVTKV